MPSKPYSHAPSPLMPINRCICVHNVADKVAVATIYMNGNQRLYY